MFEKFEKFAISAEEADEVKGGAWCFKITLNNGQHTRSCSNSKSTCESNQATATASGGAALVGPCESTYVQ